MKNKMTLLLGDLAEPLARHCERTGTTPSEAVRLAIAAMLGVSPPTMTSGNPDIGEWAKAGAAARWKQAKKRTRRKSPPST